MNLKHTSKSVVVVVLVCLFVVSTSTVVLAQEQQESEPNDAQGAATTIEGAEISGEIGSSGDTDWYAFEVEKGEEISLLVTGESPNTTLFFELVAPNGTDIAKTNFGYGDTRGQIAITAPESGTYYLEVSIVSDTEGIPYTITLSSADGTPTDTPTPTATQTPASNATPTATQVPASNTTPTATQTPSQQPQQESEPNDAQGAATTIEGAEISGEIGSSGDTDWYAFEAEKGEEISLLVTGESPNTTLFFELVAPNGTDIAKTDFGYSDTRGQIAITAPESGTYYLEVSIVSDAEGIPYTITLSSAGGTSADTPTPTATPTSTATPTPTQTSIQTPPVTSSVSPTETPTPQPTETADGSNASGGNQSGSGNEGGGSNTFGPGFGIVGALVALLAAVLVGMRRR